ncbi:hypothetical protein O181_067017 [Austropuccinia psidii MF-1]|uniref:Reverse transcriptase Ty1/copia-type domain-containing protein n=1 Tax=Austropuccinia psidii MF-1 TaxID=1389203 RepID=A0A9Q3EWJ0_9BASI|nr:hypothetical protein [Austropuccinia psidii MF-1]
MLYLAQATQPDIMYAVNYLARFAMNAQNNHWKALKHLADCINTTKQQTLKIRVDNTRKEGYGGLRRHKLGRRRLKISTWFLYYFIWHNGSLELKATILYCQAEYMALSFAAKEALWLASNLEDMIGHQCPVLLLDSKAAIQIPNNSSSKKKSGHIQREFHIINELVVSKKVTINWIATTEQTVKISEPFS